MNLEVSAITRPLSVSMLCLCFLAIAVVTSDDVTRDDVEDRGVAVSPIGMKSL